MIEEVTRYLTSDGREFDSKEEAQKCEEEWQLNRKLQDCSHYIYGALRGVEDVDDLKDFLSTNLWVLDLMGWEVKKSV